MRSCMTSPSWIEAKSPPASAHSPKFVIHRGKHISTNVGKSWALENLFPVPMDFNPLHACGCDRIAGAGHMVQQSATSDLMAAIDEAAAETLH